MKKVLSIAVTGLLLACQNTSPQSEAETNQPEAKPRVSIYAADLPNAQDSVVTIPAGGSLDFEATIPAWGRYQVRVWAQGADSARVWIEDYIHNTDDRSYNITGNMPLAGLDQYSVIDGSPLDTGLHPMRIHAHLGAVQVKKIELELMMPGMKTANFHVQSMEGEEWELVWSDEFEGEGLPDSTKWSYNVGNWGWGNNEPQYYTNARLKNVRQEDGNLIIEAHKNDMGQPWTSTRLTTQGKHAFTYGKIEFRAMVPEGRGTWAAGWLLGDSYRDEISWPYCGEIDVLETVGYEINDTTGKGRNHATCHTRAYYFKQGNQIGSEIEIDSMNTKFHTYEVQWYPNRIEAYLDGEYYFTYDKNANELEWPFSNPQNIILNLAVGGGWGGAKGIDPNYESHRYVLDYVRVYQKK